MYSPPLPFETDYVSQMSEDELLDLVHELEADGFWERENTVQRLIEQCVQRRTHGTVDFSSMATPLTAASYQEVSGYGITQRFKSIDIKMPMWMTEQQLRFFVEVQIREQMRPDYDPTDR